MTQELANLYAFNNPDKCSNHRTKAYTTTIMSNVAVPIPLEAQLALQSHSKEIYAGSYGRANKISEKRLQDGMCAIPINPEIVALNGTCNNPLALPRPIPSIPLASSSLKSLLSNLQNPQSNVPSVQGRSKSYPLTCSSNQSPKKKSL